MHLIKSPRLPTDILCAPYTPASRLEAPSPEGTSQQPIVPDSDPGPDSVSNSDSNIICYDSAHPPLSSSAHQRHTCHCPRIQVTVLEGHTPFMEWPWLEYEEFVMSTSILIENGILTIHSTICMDDGEPC